MQEPNQQRINRWLKWGAIVVLAVIYYITYKDPIAQKTEEKLKQIQQEATTDASSDVVVPQVKITEDTPLPDGKEKLSVVNGVMQNFVNKLSESETGKVLLRGLSEQAVREQSDDYKLLHWATQHPNRIHFSDMVSGDGQQIFCGSKVTMDYQAYLPGGIKFDTTYKPEHRPVTIEIGKSQVVPGLEMGLIGMQTGARRKISIPPSFGFAVSRLKIDPDYEDKVLLYDVDIQQVEAGVAPVGIKTPEYTLTRMVVGSKDKFVQCGEYVTIEYKRVLPESDASEKEIPYKRITFKLGDGTVPYGLEKALIGLHLASEHRLSLPEFWQKSRGKESLMAEDIAKNKEKMLEIHFKIISIDH